MAEFFVWRAAQDEASLSSMYAEGSSQAQRHSKEYSQPHDYRTLYLREREYADCLRSRLESTERLLDAALIAALDAQ